MREERGTRSRPKAVARPRAGALVVFAVCAPFWFGIALLIERLLG